MPPAIALIATQVAMAVFEVGTEIGLSVTAAATIANVAFYAAQLGLSLAISAGLDALLVPKLPSPEAGKTTFRLARPPKQRGYGQYRVSGPNALYESYKSTLFQVAPINDGQIASFDAWYLNDDEIAFAAAEGSQGGVVLTYPDGRYPKNGVVIQWRFGLDPEMLYGGPNSVMPGLWASTALGSGTASFLLSCTNGNLNNFTKQYPNGIPSPSVVIHASLVWDWRDETQDPDDPSTWKSSSNPIVCLRDYLTLSEGGMGFSYETTIEPLLDMWTTAANVCDAPIEVINWASFLTIGTTPDPNFIVIDDASGIVAGTRVFFGAETQTVASVAPDTFGFRVTFDDVLAFTYLKGQWVQWQVEDGSATQPRYEIGGYYTYDNDPADVVVQLLQGCDGWLTTDTQGRFVVFAGQYYPPSDGQTIPVEAIIGYELKPYLEDELAVNNLMLSFNDPAHAWTMTDTNPWTDAVDVIARGVMRSQDMKLTWVHANSQARRLAKRAMSRLTAPSGTITCNLAGIAFLGYRYLAFSIDELVSLTDVVVEVKRVRLNLQALSVTFEWVIADPNIDSWNPALEEEDGPGVGGRNAAQPLPVPTILSVTPNYVASSGEGTGTTLAVVVDSPSGDGLDWIVQVSPTGQNQWVSWTFSDVVGGYMVELDTGFVQAIGELDVQAAYSTAGSLSGFSPIFTIGAAAPSSQVITATATEDLPAGDLVHVTETSPGVYTATLATASNAALFANGFVLEEILNGAQGSVNIAGVNTAAAPGTTNSQVYLGVTPGSYSTTPPPAGNIVQTVGSTVAGAGLTFSAGSWTAVASGSATLVDTANASPYVLGAPPAVVWFVDLTNATGAALVVDVPTTSLQVGQEIQISDDGGTAGTNNFTIKSGSTVVDTIAFNAGWSMLRWNGVKWKPSS